MYIVYMYICNISIYVFSSNIFFYIFFKSLSHLYIYTYNIYNNNKYIIYIHRYYIYINGHM